MQYVKVAAHALIKKDDKYLLTQRSAVDDYMPNFWDIPGGTIEFQEKTLDALNREISEETQIKVKIGKIIFCCDNPSGSERHQFQLVYECDYEGGEVILNPEDHQQYKWVTLEEMKDLQKIAFLDALFQELIK